VDEGGLWGLKKSQKKLKKVLAGKKELVHLPAQKGK